MFRFSFATVVMLVLCLLGQPGWAQKAYVTDSLRITLRTGPSIENKIINMLSSGQPVEILDSSGEWNRVRVLQKGEITQEGWVLSQFLITRLPWEMRANALSEKNKELNEKLTAVEKELSETTQQSQEFATKLRETSSALVKLEKEYKSLRQGSADYLALKTKHESIRSELETHRKNLQRVTKENEQLRSSERIKWFITGASVLVFGLIFGLILGRKQRKRRSSIYE